MPSAAAAKREYYKSVLNGTKNTALSDLEAEYFSGVTGGTVAAGPAATTTTAGTVKKAANVPAAAVPFADLTAAANAYNALRTALINAGIMSAT